MNRKSSADKRERESKASFAELFTAVFNTEKGRRKYNPHILQKEDQYWVLFILSRISLRKKKKGQKLRDSFM